MQQVLIKSSYHPVPAPFSGASEANLSVKLHQGEKAVLSSFGWSDIHTLARSPTSLCAQSVYMLIKAIDCDRFPELGLGSASTRPSILMNCLSLRCVAVHLSVFIITVVVVVEIVIASNLLGFWGGGWLLFVCLR